MPVPYLVLKLVEGQTLAERLEKGPLPVEETLDACQQIAEALQPAHVQGIIHRDLKPDNVKITPDGQVKVLDFGLAKAIVENLSTDATTLTGNVTMPGTLLGTAPYMSPEQAKGNPVDKRSDIWSFGCVLYECLTGQRAFKGDSTSEIIGAVMHAEPNWSLLPPNTPLALHRVLRRCLVKDARNRLHDVADAQLEIAEVLAGSSDETLAFSIASGSRRWLSWGRVVALCVVSMLLGSLITALNRQNVHREEVFERGKVTSHQAKCIPYDWPRAPPYIWAREFRRRLTRWKTPRFCGGGSERNSLALPAGDRRRPAAHAHRRHEKRLQSILQSGWQLDRFLQYAGGQGSRGVVAKS